MRAFWTVAEHHRMRGLFEEGMRDEEVAAILGRSVSSVANRRHKLRIQLDSPPLRGVCRELMLRRDRIVDLLQNASAPMRVEELVPLVYGEEVAPIRAIRSVRVIIFKMRRSGFPIVNAPKRLRYIMQSGQVAA